MLLSSALICGLLLFREESYGCVYLSDDPGQDKLTRPHTRLASLVIYGAHEAAHKWNLYSFRAPLILMPELPALPEMKVRKMLAPKMKHLFQMFSHSSSDLCRPHINFT